MTVSEEALTFACGDESLVAILHRTSASGCPGVLVVVGGPQYRVGSHRQFVLMARILARAGFPVLRFDYRGMGDSSGAPRTFEQVRDDIGTAIELFARAVPDMPGIVLWGLCDAASAILMSATDDSRIQGAVLVNPWVRTDRGEAKAYVQRYYGQRLLQRSFWWKLLSGRLNIAAALISFAKTLASARGSAPAKDEEAHFIARMLRGLQRFQGRVLLLISERDLTAAEFTALCRDDRRWRDASSRRGVRTEFLAGADHTFSSRAVLDQAADRCVEWLRAEVCAVAEEGSCEPRRVRGER